jgi:purine nucleosidase
LLNFHYDPVACAVALGWSGATIEEMRLQPQRNHDVLSFQPHPEDRSTAFRETWMSAVDVVARS